MLKRLLSLAALAIASLACTNPAYPSSANGVHVLSNEDTLKLVGEISERSYLRFVKDLATVQLVDKNVLRIYIDSPGGSVMDGNRMIEQIKAHKKARGITTLCLVQDAASMAFAFVQAACDKRVIQETSVLMQHQISFGVMGPIERIASMVALGRALEKQLNEVQAKRLGMSVEEFRARISNDWYLVGADALKAKAADSFGLWLCGSDSSCPLLPEAPSPFP